jgi:phosphohistidine phosphatase
MTEFLLMRHAKSDHPSGVIDRDRPLTARGRDSAAAVGRTISAYGAVPDTILTSPALRARSTAEIAREAGGWGARIVIVDDLYGGGVRDVLAALATGTGRVMAVGHEPTWSATVSGLIGGGNIHMVTAAVACVETPGGARAGTGWLRWMIHPRLLGEG